MSKLEPQQAGQTQPKLSEKVSVKTTRQERGSSISGRRPTAILAQTTDLHQISPEEWMSLLMGEKYLCSMSQNGQTQDVNLNVSIKGIRVCETGTDKELNHFDIEQILQYSYSQQNSVFSFSYLEEGRFFVTHKFQTPQFLEIHQYLGNAIAIVIKIKTQMKKQSSVTDFVESIINSKPSSDEELQAEDMNSHTSDSIRSESSSNSGTPKSEKSRSEDADDNDDSPKKGDTSKKGSKSLTGSVRVKGFTDIMQFNFQNSLRKKKSMEVEKLKSTFDFKEYNPEQMPETVTKTDENGIPVLIRTMIDGKYQITAGTVDALIESLADHQQPDSLYIDVFLQTYRNFLTPLDLMTKLRKRFSFDKMKVVKEEQSKMNQDPDKPPELMELDAETMKLVKVRLVSVVKKWIERHWYDFELPEVRKELDGFIADIKSKGLENFQPQLLNAIKKHEEDKNIVVVHVPKNEPITNFDFSAAPPKETAQAMTMVAIEYLKAIPPDEFVFFLWGKKSDPRTPKMTQNLQRLIDRFNKVGFWVATEICAVNDLRKRTLVLEKFILIAKYLFKLQNFNDLIAVLFGLNSIPIYRLKKTWAGVPQKSTGVFKDLEDKMKADGNYKIYRAIEYNAQPPYIPFFGLYMKDLTFMNDGNQTYLANSMVNVEKHRSIMSAIMSIRISQQSDYKFNVDESLRKYCEVMYCREEEELTTQSYVLEPSLRQARRPSIASVGSENTPTEVSEDTASVHSEASNDISSVA